MDLNTLRTKNKGYRTLNLDGVLFLINDSSDEFGQHYESKTKPNAEIKSMLLKRKQLLKVPYIFAIVPDKTVFMDNYISKHIKVGKLKRDDVMKVKDLDFVIDTYDDIIHINDEIKCHPCISGDTHPHM